MTIDALEFLDIMDYLDELTDTGNLSPAQCVADEFDLSLEMAEKLVRMWEEVERRKASQ